MLKLVLIFVAAGVGGVARYGLHTLLQRSGSFPIGTLVVNVLGCFAIGFAAVTFSNLTNVREEYRLAVIVGLLGGFTTYSTFAIETYQLLEGRQFVAAALNIVLSAALGLLGVWCGMRFAERLA